MHWGEIEPLTLGGPSSDEDHYTIPLPRFHLFFGQTFNERNLKANFFNPTNLKFVNKKLAKINKVNCDWPNLKIESSVNIFS